MDLKEKLLALTVIALPVNSQSSSSKNPQNNIFSHTISCIMPYCCNKIDNFLRKCNVRSILTNNVLRLLIMTHYITTFPLLSKLLNLIYNFLMLLFSSPSWVNCPDGINWEWQVKHLYIYTNKKCLYSTVSKIQQAFIGTVQNMASFLFYFDPFGRLLGFTLLVKTKGE